MLILSIIVALVLIDVWLFATDRYIWSFTLLVASTVAAYFYIPEVAALIATYGWIEVAKYAIPGYLMFGAATASLKWLSFARGVADRLTELRQEFDTEYRVPKVSVSKAKDEDRGDPTHIQGLKNTEEVLVPMEGKELIRDRRQSYLDRVNHSSRYIFKRSNIIAYRSDNYDLTNDDVFVSLLTPRTGDYIERVTFWVLQWPIVLINFVFEDLLIKIGRHIARLIDVVFNRLARMFVSGAVKGL